MSEILQNTVKTIDFDGVDFYVGKEVTGLKENLRVELAGLKERNITYNMFDHHESSFGVEMRYHSFPVYGVGDSKKFLNDYLLKLYDVSNPQITLYCENRHGLRDLNKSEVKTIIKACDLFSDIFASIAFRNVLGISKLIRDNLTERYGISYYIDGLDKKELIKAYKESGQRKFNPDGVLPSMVYNGKEIVGLKNIIISMDKAVKEVSDFAKKKRSLTRDEKNKITWWREEFIARTTGISHGDDVHSIPDPYNKRH